MGIREKINENPKPYVIGAGVIIALGVALMVWQMRGGSSDGEPTSSGKAFFTDDDGKTKFEEAYEKLGDPNFKGPHGGEPVLARVFQYPGEQPFIAYLETYMDEGKQALRTFYADPANKGKTPPDIQVEPYRLIKKPGDENWVKNGEPGSSQILAVDTKNGAYAISVTPVKK